MIRWLEPLFVSESAVKEQKRLVKRIKKRRGLLDIYVLMMPANDEDQLEIMNANYLLQPWYQKRDVTIVGLAKTKQSAVELLIRMVDEAVKSQGTPDIKSYLKMLLVGKG